MHRHHDSPIMRMAFHANAAEPADAFALHYPWQYLHPTDTARSQPRSSAVHRILAGVRSRVWSSRKPRR